VIPRFASALLRGEPPVICGDGHQSRDFTYVDNVVDANVLALTAPGAPGGVFNIACGERIDLLTLVALLQELTGRPVAPRHAPPRVGDVPHSLADVSRAREVLGFRPRVDFKEGLRRTVESLRLGRPEVD
jgi:UDP-glucose 4-epimerase